MTWQRRSQGAGHVAPQRCQQPEGIVGRDAQRAGDGGPLSFFGKKPAEHGLAQGVAERLGLSSGAIGKLVDRDIARLSDKD